MSSKKNLVPKLRFPEFRGAGEWEKKRIGNVLKVGSGRDYKHLNNGDVPVYGTGGYMTSVDKFLYNGESVCIGRKGTIDKPLYLNCKFWTVDTLFFTHSFRSVLPKFVYAIFLLINWKKHNQASGVPSLQRTTIEKIEISIPPILEQQKIADCLSSIDDLITAKAQKLDSLKAHKKGLMQQLFPAESKTQPKRRFPEFRDAGAWEKKRLGILCDVLNNRRKPITGSDRIKGEYPYYGASGIVDHVNDYIFKEPLLLIGEDGAKWGAFENTAFLVDGKYWVNNHAHVLRPNAISNILLENYLTMIDIGPFITGAAPPKLTLGMLKKIPVPIPPTDKEQQKIADCLSSIDDLVTAQAQKLDVLKAHKKGLMQKLFPSSNEIGA